MKLSAIILAGGKSSRMKYNKELIKIKDQFLVHMQINQLKDIFNEIIIVSNNASHYQGLNVKVVQDILIGNSPIIGLHAGLSSSNNLHNYVNACDMPNINKKYIHYLINTCQDSAAYVAKQNNYIEPFNAIYSKKIIPNIEAFVNENQFGFQRLVRSLDTHYISEEEVAKFNTSNMFMNINNEEDLLDRTREYAPIMQSFNIKRVEDKTTYNKIDNVITEFPLSLFINNQFYSIIMITPKDIEFMVIGYLHSNMLINDIADIKEIDILLKEKECHITLHHTIPNKRQDRLDIISSACASNTKVINEDILPVITKNNQFDLNTIFDQVSHFNKESILFKETGGVHSVLLYYGEDSMLFEDIGRHNAVDKAVGFILKNQLKDEKTYLLTSGRISSDILIKSALMNIELIISRSAPTALAVRLGRKLGVKIYGFARGRKLNIYN